jgi:hypothetical protein
VKTISAPQSIGDRPSIERIARDKVANLELAPSESSVRVSPVSMACRVSPLTSK